MKQDVGRGRGGAEYFNYWTTEATLEHEQDSLVVKLGAVNRASVFSFVVNNL